MAVGLRQTIYRYTYLVDILTQSSHNFWGILNDLSPTLQHISRVKGPSLEQKLIPMNHTAKYTTVKVRGEKAILCWASKWLHSRALSQNVGNISSYQVKLSRKRTFHLSCPQKQLRNHSGQNLSRRTLVGWLKFGSVTWHVWLKGVA